MMSNRRIQIGWLTLMIGAAFPAAIQAEFISGIVTAGAGAEEATPDDPHETGVGESPSVHARLAFSDERFTFLAESSASISNGAGSVGAHLSSYARTDGELVTGARTSATATWTDIIYFQDLDFAGNPKPVRPEGINWRSFLDVEGEIHDSGDIDPATHQRGEGTLAVGAQSRGEILLLESSFHTLINETFEIEMHMDYIPGSPSRYSAELTFFAHTFAFAYGESALASVDILNTVTWGGFLFTDVNGIPLQGLITSESGVNYNPVPQALPEPGSLTLAGLGAIGMAVGAWRRRQFQ